MEYNWPYIFFTETSEPKFAGKARTWFWKISTKWTELKIDLFPNGIWGGENWSCGWSYWWSQEHPSVTGLRRTKINGPLKCTTAQFWWYSLPLAHHGWRYFSKCRRPSWLHGSWLKILEKCCRRKELIQVIRLKKNGEITRKRLELRSLHAG